ncbi:MAG: hypothetical protein COX07_02120, partial [Bacteroidetes bacterium CG23_combo_of_CG06-09_8_20_14_all_32_9]
TPGNGGWSVGNNGSTKNSTLIRNYGVSSGQSDWGCGQEQWGVYGQDDVSNLGSHDNQCKWNVVITPTDYNGEAPQNSFLFYENKGQLINTSDSLVPEIKYYVQNSTPEYYIKKNSFSFVFARVDTIPSTTDTLHRIDVEFYNVNANAKTYSLEEQPGYLNYFLGHCPEGITNIHGNLRLITTDLFLHIDLMYSSNQNGIKYYFIVKPGANPADIQFIFSGASSFNLNGTTNALTINSSIGSLTFERPTVYQLEDNNAVDTITGWTADWKTNGANNKYKFNIGSYNTTKPLIIQVDEGHLQLQQQQATENLLWSTYFGGSNWDELLSIKILNNGIKAVTGSTYSSIFPFTPNLFTGYYYSGDVLLSVFGVNNERLTTAIIGGSNIDYGEDIVFGNNNNVFITGVTTSSNFPPKENTFYSINDATYGGVSDWFILEYDYTTNSVTWSTYFGGPSGDNGEKILFDNNNNLYVIGAAHEGFPPIDLPGATNLSYNGTGYFSTYILKIAPNGQAIWGTYYWGAKEVFPYSACFDNNNNLFITGEATGNLTQSNNPPGAWVRNFSGGNNYDGFIIRYNNQGAITWATCLGGTQNQNEDMEGKNSIVLDNSGNIILIGATLCSDFPTINTYNYSTYNTTLHGESDGFIMQFDSNFDLKWSTYLGGNNSEWFTSIALLNDNIFITGMTNSTDYNTVQPPNTFIQWQLGIAYDAFVTCLNANRDIIWSTYFGGGGSSSDANDWAKCSEIYNNSLFVIGNTNSSNIDTNYFFFPIVDYGNNAYFQDIYSGGGYDGFISMFDLSPLISIPENFIEQSNFNIYPNPSNDKINISFNNSTMSNVEIKIFNISGKLVLNKKISNSIGEQNILVNIKCLLQGIYNIQLVTDNFTSTKKFIEF